MEAREYLASFGLTGEFGRFRASGPLACRRGDRVVVRSHRGVELAEVLRQATPRHAAFLPNTSVGQLLRRFGPADEEAAARGRERGRQIFEHGRQLAADLGLPLELLDVEVLLDGQHAVLHHLRWGDCDVRPFVSTLSREHELHVTLEDLTRPLGASPHQEEHEGCGREGCGRESGGCGTCGSGGGCSTCGVSAHFAQLREQMDRRTALL